jgi:hypothetical protein
MFNSASYRKIVTRHFLEFVRLSSHEKLAVISREAVLLDTDTEQGKLVKLYFVRGFFIEKVVDPATMATEIIPYKSGFRPFSLLNPGNQSN